MTRTEGIIPPNRIVTGRGATALYLVFASCLRNGRRVLFPANICYAAIYPALYAGCAPVFCDVDPRSGNVTVHTVRKALEGNRVDAVVLPHMYGRPIDGLPEVVELVHSAGAIVIEDCASALGAIGNDGVRVGSHGDYAVFSTGYSKTVDMGFGGVLASTSRDVEGFRNLLDGLPFWDEAARRIGRYFSVQYRALRNQSLDSEDFGRDVFSSLAPSLTSLFLNRLDEEMESAVVGALERANGTIEGRIAAYRSWSEQLEGVIPKGVLYTYPEGSVPWRFSFFVKASRRGKLTARLLERSVPVSDWYPPVARLFGSRESFPGAERMGSTILNLPLPMPEGDAGRHACMIADALTSFDDSVFMTDGETDDV